ncbi:MAG: tetratricopeptide repeat protein [Gemmatimonadota bacterium]
MEKAARTLCTMPLVAAALLVAGGCATKSDIRSLRQDLVAAQQRQESAMLEIQRQNRVVLDSLNSTMSMTVNASGTTANQMRQFERNVAELGQLVGQVMGTLNRIEQRLAELERRPVAAPAGGTISSGGTAEQYYEMGVLKQSEGSYSAARLAFEQVVTEYPEHERAPDAQFQLGETYYLQELFDEAYASFEAVAERWPVAPRSPAALYRAGAIAEERRELDRARAYFERVRDRYEDSPEAEQARQRLTDLRRR